MSTIVSELNRAREARETEARQRIDLLLDKAAGDDNLADAELHEINNLADVLGITDELIEREIAWRRELQQLAEGLKDKESVEAQMSAASAAGREFRNDTRKLQDEIAVKREPSQTRLDEATAELRSQTDTLRSLADRKMSLVSAGSPMQTALRRVAGPAVADEDAALARAVAIANAQTAEEIAWQKRSRQVRKGQGVSEEAAYRRAVEVAGIESRQVAARRAQRAGG